MPLAATPAGSLAASPDRAGRIEWPPGMLAEVAVLDEPGTSSGGPCGLYSILAKANSHQAEPFAHVYLC